MYSIACLSCFVLSLDNNDLLDMYSHVFTPPKTIDGNVINIKDFVSSRTLTAQHHIL